jgi:hypothetical protein
MVDIYALLSHHAGMKKLPSKDRVRELLDYNQETGDFTWRVKVAQRCPAGSKAGTKCSRYMTVSIDKKIYFLHRIAWLHATGEDPGELFIDHIDGNPINNSFSNLRIATFSQNMRNCKKPKQNKSGLKGAYFVKRLGKYRSCIRVLGKTLNLGCFETAEEAHAAYINAARTHYGEFARSS